MKKLIVLFILVIVFLVAVVVYNFNVYKNETIKIQKINEEYEEYARGEILGTSLITLINRSIDLNNQNKVAQENNIYIENDTNSIKIEVKFQDSEDIFQMEKISRAGSENFIKNYATAYFKCTEKQYHKQTKCIKYMLFEQI